MNNKYNYLVLKLGVSILLVGLGFRFIFSRSNGFSLDSNVPFQDIAAGSAVNLSWTNSAAPLVNLSLPENKSTPSKGTEF